jgi:hypothetical protein
MIRHRVDLRGFVVADDDCVLSSRDEKLLVDELAFLRLKKKQRPQVYYTSETESSDGDSVESERSDESSDGESYDSAFDSYETVYTSGSESGGK